MRYDPPSARAFNLPPTVDDAWLRARVANDYGRYGGTHALARALGVSPSTASLLRRGIGTLAKVGALYGYVPSGPEEWKRSSVKLDPRHIGRMRWTPAVDEFIRQSLQNTLGMERIAQHLGTTRLRVADRIARMKLREGEAGSLQAVMDAAAARLVARAEVNMARRQLRRAEARANKIFQQTEALQ